MYSKNENLQAVDSRNKVRDALLSLLKKFPYNEISITQICYEARIVRQTYYRNFEQKDDILKYHLDEMVRHFFDNYYIENDVNAQMMNFFGYLLENREFLNLMAKNDLFFIIDDTIIKKINEIFNFQQIRKADDPHMEKYFTNFIAATVCSLLELWVTNGFEESPEMLSGLAQRFLSGANADN